jgi:hypothetical protein
MAVARQSQLSAPPQAVITAARTATVFTVFLILILKFFIYTFFNYEIMNYEPKIFFAKRIKSSTLNSQLSFTVQSSEAKNCRTTPNWGFFVPDIKIPPIGGSENLL